MHNVMFLCSGTMIPIEAWNHSFRIISNNLGQFPAQVFDKINENFIRCSFYELVSRYLSSCYTFAIEQNNSAGRL